MPFLKSLPEDAGPFNIFTRYPEIYDHWSQMSQALMNGPSPLSQGERELILAYAAAVAGCDFVAIAHSEVAYAWGVPEGVVEQLLRDPASTPLDARLKVLLEFVRKLMTSPQGITQPDVDEVLAAGWDDRALHDAVAVTARAAFMQRLSAGFGFTPLTREAAARHARKRVERGYVNVVTQFRDGKPKDLGSS